MKKISLKKSKRFAAYVKKNLILMMVMMMMWMTKKYHKVRDHCHYNGKIRGAAHNIFKIQNTKGNYCSIS